MCNVKCLMLKKTHLKEKIKDKAKQLGFNLIGFSVAEPVEEEIKNFYLDWIKKGYHGKMEFLERNIDKRMNPKEIMPDAKTIISLGINYNTNTPLSSLFSKYVVGKDYHIVIKKKMKKLLEWLEENFPGINGKYFIDSGYVLEKYWAQKSGIGWIGKNTCLITEKYGSWIFLSELIINFEIEPDLPCKNLCGKCNKCIENCPNNSLLGNYTIDAKKCISYLNIEYKNKLTSEEKKFLLFYLFGCDLCQLVCPYNINTNLTQEPDFLINKNIHYKDIKFFKEFDEKKFKNFFAETSVNRISFEKFKENLEAIEGKNLCKLNSYIV